MNPYRHPNRYVRAGAYTAGALSTLGAARRVMGAYAPTAKDLSYVYNYAKRKFKKGRASKYRRRYGASKKPFPKKVKSQIRELKRLAESDMGILTYRSRAVGRVIATAGVQAVSATAGSATSIIETALGQLRYYNPSAPSSLTTADGASGTYQKEFLIDTTYSSLIIRNNYQVPCKVSVYVCVPKEDTSIAPQTAWSNGLTDESNSANTVVNIYPSDSSQFNDLWKIKKSIRKELQAGSELNVSDSHKSFQYDPSLYDSHPTEYSRKCGSVAYMIVIQGVVCHDTALDEQTTIGCGVDWMLDRTLKIKYSAGADIRYTYINNSLDTLTNSGVVSSKPVADNIGYSLS